MGLGMIHLMNQSNKILDYTYFSCKLLLPSYSLHWRRYIFKAGDANAVADSTISSFQPRLMNFFLVNQYKLALSTLATVMNSFFEDSVPNCEKYRFQAPCFWLFIWSINHHHHVDI